MIQVDYFAAPGTVRGVTIDIGQSLRQIAGLAVLCLVLVAVIKVQQGTEPLELVRHPELLLEGWLDGPDAAELTARR